MKMKLSQIAIFICLLIFHQSFAQHVLMSGWGDGASNDFFLGQMETHLIDLGYSVTQSDTFPDSVDDYDILFLMGGGYGDDIPEAVVDDFVEAGGGIIIFEPIVRADLFDTTANSNPVSDHVGWDERTGVTVIDPDHALCEGLEATMTYSGYSINPVMKTGSQILMVWDDQSVFAAVYTYGSGRVIYLNWSNTWYYNYWGTDGNGKRFMENAMAWFYPITDVHESSIHSNPRNFALYQNFPNPFNPKTVISYDVKNPCHVIVKVFNTMGQEVCCLIDSFHSTGSFETEFNLEAIPSGLYLYQIQMGDFLAIKKMVKLE